MDSIEAILADARWMNIFPLIAMAGCVIWVCWLLNASNERMARRQELDNRDFFRQLEETRRELRDREGFNRRLAELDRKLEASRRAHEQQQHQLTHTRDFSALAREIET
jgi:biopolymer transport protein ExbB/TolQ